MIIGPGANYACEIASLLASPALSTPAKFATLLRSIKQPPSYFIPRSGDHSGCPPTGATRRRGIIQGGKLEHFRIDFLGKGLKIRVVEGCFALAFGLIGKD